MVPDATDVDALEDMPLIAASPRVRKGRSWKVQAVVDLVNALMPCSLIASGVGVGYTIFKPEDKTGIQMLFISIGVALQALLHVNLNLSPKVKRQALQTVALLAYQVYIYFWQVVLKHPGLYFLMYIPIINYFVSLGAEVHYAFYRARQVIQKPEILDSLPPMQPGEKSIFFYPDPRQTLPFLGINALESTLGIGSIGLGLGLQNQPALAQFFLIGGALVTGEGAGACGGKFFQDYLQTINEVVKKLREDSQAHRTTIPWKNKLCILLQEVGIEHLAPILASVITAFALDAKWPYLLIPGLLLGLKRQAAMRHILCSSSKVIKPKLKAQEPLAHGLAWTSTLAMSVALPTFTWIEAAHAKNQEKALTIGSALILTGSFFTFYVGSKAIKCIWKKRIEEHISLQQRGKTLCTLRLWISEHSQWISFLSLVLFHAGNNPADSPLLSDSEYLGGYSALSASLAKDLNEMNDIHLSRFGIPRATDLSHVVMWRYIKTGLWQGRVVG